MNKSDKNRNYLVVIFEIIIIILGIVGITLATTKLLNDRTVTNLKTDEYNVDYQGDKDIVIEKLEPIDDEKININTHDNVIRLEFSLKGVSTNKKDDIIYDIMLSDMNIDCSLLNKYTKWNLYKNGKLLTTGSLDPQFDGNVLSDNMRLTLKQEDLPKYNEESDKYVLIFWISESCDDLLTCELIDQSDIVNSKMSMKVFIALYTGAKKNYYRIPNYDTSCANKPELYGNMIGVSYKNGNFVVANTDNSTKENMWYDYGKQVWANAVVVRDKSKYMEIGTVINNSDVLGYYVWIPRYKYKLWNATDEVTDSYNAYDNGIDITFSTGIDDNSSNSYENNTYITHPAFKNNKGFWISKYEISKNGQDYLFLPNMTAYQNDTIDNYKNILSNLSNSYKLGDKAESRMVNNLDWGATLYLSHSKYGVCNGDGCNSISVNDTYVAGNNKQDTVTRNVYGVYDMAGASSEYVLGNSTIGSATNEVFLANGDTWNQGHSLVSNRDYLLRGGIGSSIFYFGEIGINSTLISTRGVIEAK